MSRAFSTSRLSCLPSQPILKLIRISVKACGHSFSWSPSTSTSSDLNGWSNFLRRRMALIPVQPPSAPSSISVGRMPSSSPKAGGSSISAVWPELARMSNLTLLPDHRATAFCMILFSDMSEDVRKAFAPVAANYVTSSYHAGQEWLDEALEVGPPLPADRGVHGATGTRHLALALAPQVSRVTR